MSEETKPFVAETTAVEKRLWRFLAVSLALECVLSLILADLKFMFGIIVGGSLAMFNFYLLQNSVRGLFQTQSNSFAIKFFLRFVIIGLVIWGFYLLEIVSITAVLLGLSSFAAALMLEAIVQFYFVITKHEEL
jgi:ATP synthase I chain